MKRILGAIAIIGVMGILYMQALAGDDGDVAYGISRKWGTYQAEKTTNVMKGRSKDVALYAKGKKAVITEEEMEQAIYFFELQELDTKTAEETAYAYMKESAALYEKALEEGENVTDEEVKAYVRELRAMYEDENLDEVSREEMEGVIAGFGDEEAYWEYQETVYSKLLVTQKFVDTLQEEYYSSNPGDSEGWKKYFSDYKNGLVESEQFERL